MTEMRDYYLNNLGVGEVWRLRQSVKSTVEEPIDESEVIVAAVTAPMQALTATIDDKHFNPWHKMQAELQQCQACSLCAKFGKGVLGTGDATASILVIADWSISEKLAQLDPALQQSEKLMLNMLNALLADDAQSKQSSVKRDIYRTSILKAQISDLSQAKLSAMASDAARLCMSFLIKQISSVQPQIVLVFGEQLGRILLGRENDEGDMRQMQHAYQRIPVVVTYDAHFLLEHPESKYAVWQDLCKVKHLLAWS
ncbi:uracil-DNA glycosylase family protein [Undibacterium sp. Di24W]|uniref:uracil-DNA glycosylase family protein n=1 Tax=Undibacterium sp. Di24W TaxID=3413033 RepID=UPI003BF1779F